MGECERDRQTERERYARVVRIEKNINAMYRTMKTQQTSIYRHFIYTKNTLTRVRTRHSLVIGFDLCRARPPFASLLIVRTNYHLFAGLVQQYVCTHYYVPGLLMCLRVAVRENNEMCKQTKRGVQTTVLRSRYALPKTVVITTCCVCTAVMNRVDSRSANSETNCCVLRNCNGITSSTESLGPVRPHRADEKPSFPVDYSNSQFVEYGENTYEQRPRSRYPRKAKFRIVRNCKSMFLVTILTLVEKCYTYAPGSNEWLNIYIRYNSNIINTINSHL